MPNDGGVDVVSGACAPPPKEPPKKQKVKSKDQIKKSKGALKTKVRESEDQYEICSAERTLIIEPGVCSWFLIKVRGKRLADKDRRKLEKTLKKVVSDHCKNVPTHAEPHGM